MASSHSHIVFDGSKNERYSVFHHYKSLVRRLRKSNKVSVNKDTLTTLNLHDVNTLVISSPQDHFTSDEIDHLHHYLKQGGTIFVLLSSGGEAKLGTNINYFLEDYGISVASDTVIRSTYLDKANPSNCVLSDALCIPSMLSLLSSSPNSDDLLPPVIFPNGASLIVQSPALPLVLSGSLSFPVNRSLIAGCLIKPDNMTKVVDPLHESAGFGKLIVFGSSEMFCDDFIAQYNNMSLADAMFQIALNPTDIASLKVFDAILEGSSVGSFKVTTELADHRTVPEIGAWATKPKARLQSIDGFHHLSDPIRMIDEKLFALDTRHIPMSGKLHESLSLSHKPLTLIEPQFSSPLPSLTPAVFIPSAQEPSPPPLDLFDLDDEWASEHLNLAKLMSKCSGSKDVEYFVTEASHMLGIRNKVATADPKHYLYYVVSQLIKFKKFNVGSGIDESNKERIGVEHRENGVDMLTVMNK
ncbi:hypothetical protein P9112_003989 [Eukaryota sp. TZLM1-RC]